MFLIKTPQLFINDTVIADDEIQKVIPRSVQAVVVNSKDLAQELGREREKKNCIYVFPGTGANIFLDAFERQVQDFSDAIQIEPKRKLQGLTPRGLDISNGDRQKLQNIAGERTVCDDVIASGTTINGLIKILNPQQGAVYTLVLRQANQVSKKIRDCIVAGITVSSPTGGYAKINTLSTLTQETDKAKAVLASRQNDYGNTFAQDMKNLLLSTNK